MNPAARTSSRTDPKSKSTHARTAVVAGGAGALLWWLLRRSGGGGAAGGGRPVAGLEAVAEAARPPCQIRLSSVGWTIDGQHVAGVADVLAACRRARDVSLFVTGGANYGELVKAREAFAAAGLSLIESRKLP